MNPVWDEDLYAGCFFQKLERSVQMDVGNDILLDPAKFDDEFSPRKRKEEDIIEEDEERRVLVRCEANWDHE